MPRSPRSDPRTPSTWKRVVASTYTQDEAVRFVARGSRGIGEPETTRDVLNRTAFALAVARVLAAS